MRVKAISKSQPKLMIAGVPVIEQKSKGNGVRLISSSSADATHTIPQPFLKWAGGKRALLPELRALTPVYQGKYIEPFLGAGALFFDQDVTKMKIVSDFNNDLMDVYLAIKFDLEELLQELDTHINTSEHYYEVRAWDRQDDWSSRSRVQKAARFIYLNKTNYNGLYRVNAAGHMNVPYGGQVRPNWIQKELLSAVSAFLNYKDSEGSETTKLYSGSYKTATKLASPGDWVYLDPPYADTFTNYQSGGFTAQDQEELRDEILRLTTETGVPVLLSNSDVPLIHRLYQDKKHKEFFKLKKVPVTRYIGSRVSSRGAATEVMITNYKFLGVEV